MAASKEKLLAEWFWVDRWTGSSAFALPLESRGLYREMLSQAWRRGARLPNDPEQIRRMTGVTEKEWNRSWKRVQPYWRVDGADLVNDTQLEVYTETKRRQVVLSERGRSGSESRWQARSDVTLSTTQVQPRHEQDACLSNAQALLKHSVSSAQVVLNGMRNEWPPSPSPSPDQREEISLNVRDQAETDKTDKAAGFLDRYPVVYAKVRHGARYLVKPVRDFYYAQQLVAAWPDLDRLDLMAEVFLRMSAKEANNIPGTPGQFLHMAPECDARLREYGR